MRESLNRCGGDYTCCLSTADMEWPKRLAGRLLYDAATTCLWVDGARDVVLGVLVIYTPLRAVTFSLRS